MRDVLLEINKLFQNVFDDPSLVVNSQITAMDIQDWDSLMHVQLIVAIEKHFEISFTSEEIQKLQNVGDMVNVITSKLNQGS
jgi:acyl carrier protein